MVYSRSWVGKIARGAEVGRIGPTPPSLAHSARNAERVPGQRAYTFAAMRSLVRTRDGDVCGEKSLTPGSESVPAEKASAIARRLAHASRPAIYAMHSPCRFDIRTASIQLVTYRPATTPMPIPGQDRG